MIAMVLLWKMVIATHITSRDHNHGAAVIVVGKQWIIVKITIYWSVKITIGN